MDSVNVALLESGEEAAWDSFVSEVPEGTFFHRAGWKRVIERAFGHKTFYLTAKRCGAICGVLPLTRVKSILFGHSLISNAFCVRGGPLAQDPEIHERLENEAIRIAQDLGAGNLEFRSSGSSGKGWQVREAMYANFRRPIAADPEANLKAIPRKQRAMVRKGITKGLKAELDPNVKRFHHVYAQSVRNLGTPVFSERYFELLKNEFDKDCDIVTVFDDGQPIASVLNFYFRDDVLPYYGGGTRQARAVAGNDFMYWEVMRRASDRGYRFFDFGRSKIGTGAYDFKHNWGFEPSPLTYEYFPLGAHDVGNVNPLNPKYRAAISLWQRLPLPVTKFIGPAIVRSIG